MANYRVQLDTYNGPLDLLLYLIRREEVDIYDIPIARITSQYIEYVNLLEMLDPDGVSEYLVLLATLIEIKSRTLMPPEMLPLEYLVPPGDTEALSRKVIRLLQDRQTLAEARRWARRQAHHFRWQRIAQSLAETYEEALADVTSAIRFHIETFGKEVLDAESSVLEVFVAETRIAG